MLWSIDSCQNKVSADQYHLTVSRAQVSTHRGQVFFEVIRWQGTGFQMIAGLSLIFLKSIWNMLCLCAAQLKFWFQSDLGRENAASCYRQGRQLLLTFLATFTRWSRSTTNFHALIGQNLTGEFVQKIYAASWIFRAEKRSAQASTHPLSQAQGGLFCVLTVFDSLFVCHWESSD